MKKGLLKFIFHNIFTTLSDFRKLKLLNSTAFILILKFSCASKLRAFNSSFQKLAFSKDIFKLEYLHV
ncbi:hypothetical protein T12_7406 [Trichinella patagoniensis]|uniref:Uncharacterized protein n=1 Tax=Trichinella patagoniensis TaxID=990121 RepID=A0A0V1AC76_9BILA|nr:hypothetical protein T12_7406 [Trichinella patagoniensis]